MIERAGLAIEYVRICVAAVRDFDEIDEAGALERCQRIFHDVGVEIADDQEIRIVARGRIRLQPVCDRDSRVPARLVAIALAVTPVRVTIFFAT